MEVFDDAYTLRLVHLPELGVDVDMTCDSA